MHQLRKSMKYAFAIMLAALPCRAATITAASPSRADVLTAITASVTGDTVQVPAGLAVWTTNITFTGKGITLRGAGTNITIIVDENPNNRVNQPSLLDITWQGTNGGMFDLSGFQFRGGTNQTSTLATGMLQFTASNNMTNDSVWRIHNCLFNDPWGRPMQVRAWSGLIDSNVFYLTRHLSGISFDNRIVSGEYGDRAWAEPVPMGTTNLLYFEHNVVDATGTARAILDAFGGVRYCCRYNVLNNRSVENHGTESTQRVRSGRWMEIYGNIFTKTFGSGEYCTLFRGGSGIVMSNKVVGTWPGLVKLVYFLSNQSHGPWRMANGTNVWDLNFAGPVETGTHNGGNGSANLIDTTKTWTVNQWAGFSVINYSQTFTNPNPGTFTEQMAALITGNTATSAQLTVPTPAFEQFTWNNGNVYKFWRVDVGLDAPGRGSGDLLIGGSDTVPPTPTTFPNQPDEPIYIWANTGVNNVASGAYPIAQGRDWSYGSLTGYIPLMNPHPLAGGTNALPPDLTCAPPSGLIFVP
jgi:hypothetical protein